MNPEEIKNIIETLLKTGEFLAVKSFELAMRKAYFIGAWDIIIGVLILVVGIVALNRLIYAIKNYDDLNEDVIGFLGAFGVLGTLFSFPIGIILIYNGTDWLFNPELGAIRILVDLLKSVR